jgi:hypothetical protein
MQGTQLACREQLGLGALLRDTSKLALTPELLPGFE